MIFHNIILKYVPKQYFSVREKLPYHRGIPTNQLGTHTNPRGKTPLDLGKDSLMESGNTHRGDQLCTQGPTPTLGRSLTLVEPVTVHC